MGARWTKTLTVRLRAEEHAAITQLARKAGHRTLSRWVRDIMRRQIAAGKTRS